ncbi:putative Enoyl reductase (ER) domain-containing protein [Seiridium cardinale]
MPKQAIVQPSIEAVEIVDTPIPIPQDKEVVIRVVVAGTNPKDWKYPLWKNWPHNSGDDMAGIVHSVGKDVYEFKTGDRVAAFHETGKENGTFAEYSVAPDWMTFHIAPTVSFEEAATMPVAAMTAAIALFADMKLPTPYEIGESGHGADKVPLLIYGITSAVGAFAAKLARLSGIRPIIGIAGRAGDFARTLADHVVDYREGEDAVVTAALEVLAKEGLGPRFPYIFDAISEGGSLEATLRLIDADHGVVSTVLPPKLFAKDGERYEYPPGVTAFNSAVPQTFSTRSDFGYLWSRYFGRLLASGSLKAHPHEVIPGGLDGLLTGLQKLRDGKASAVKYVYRIEETKDALNSDQKVAEQESRRVGNTESSRTESSHPLSVFPFPS